MIWVAWGFRISHQGRQCRSSRGSTGPVPASQLTGFFGARDKTRLATRKAKVAPTHHGDLKTNPDKASSGAKGVRFQVINARSMLPLFSFAIHGKELSSRPRHANQANVQRHLPLLPPGSSPAASSRLLPEPSNAPSSRTPAKPLARWFVSAWKASLNKETTKEP
jgi:hypothetical protein